MSSVEDIYGNVIHVQIQVDKLFDIIIEQGTYGSSGAKIRGVYGGSDLEYYRYGSGPNVLFTTFCVHGYEDSWDRDGTVLDFYNKLSQDRDLNIAKNWTIYIFKEVNPDGRRLGTTKDGPGRTTLYSQLGQGMDMNRCWQTNSTYKKYTTKRNYNGTAGFQAYEADYLRNFMLSHKSTSGKTVLVDLHGWEEQLIGDEQVCKYYKEQYTSCRTTGYGRYGTQYIITWGKEILGADVSLVELPLAANYDQVDSMQLSNKYVNATLNLLRNYPISSFTTNAKMSAKKSLKFVTLIDDNIKSDYEIAFAGMIKQGLPEYDEIDTIIEKNMPSENGIWINPKDSEKILNFLNNSEELNYNYYINENNYLQIETINDYNVIGNENDNKIKDMIYGNKKYLFSISSICYQKNIISDEIIDNRYNELDKSQPYEYFEKDNDVILFITENNDKIYTDNEIFESIISLIDLI